MAANTNKLEASAAMVLDRRFPGVSGNGKKQTTPTAASSKMAARVKYQDFLPDVGMLGKGSSNQSQDTFQ